MMFPAASAIGRSRRDCGNLEAAGLAMGTSALALPQSPRLRES